MDPVFSDLLGQIDQLRASVIEAQGKLAARESETPGCGLGSSNSEDRDETKDGVRRVLEAIEESLTDPSAKENGYTVLFSLIERLAGKGAQSVVSCQSETDMAANIIPDDDLSGFAKAFSNPGRLRLLRAFAGGDRTPSQLTEITGLAGGRLYHHLKWLTYIGFVSSDGRGTHELTQLGKTAYLGLNLLATTAKKYEERRKMRESGEARD